MPPSSTCSKVEGSSPLSEDSTHTYTHTVCACATDTQRTATHWEVHVCACVCVCPFSACCALVYVQLCFFSPLINGTCYYQELCIFFTLVIVYYTLGAYTHLLHAVLFAQR